MDTWEGQVHPTDLNAAVCLKHPGNRTLAKSLDTAVSVSFQIGRILRSTLKPSASWVVYLEMSHGVGQYFDGKYFAVNMILEALPKINCRKQKWNTTDTGSASTYLALCDKWIKSEKWPHQAFWRDHIHNPKGFFSASHFSGDLQKLTDFVTHCISKQFSQVTNSATCSQHPWRTRPVWPHYM